MEAPQPQVQASPGLETLLSEMPNDRSWSVLDLGRAVNDNVQMLGPRAARLQIVDLFRGSSHIVVGPALDTLTPGLTGVFDLVLAWDTLSYLPTPPAKRLVSTLGGLCRCGARLHVLTFAADTMPASPGRYRILEAGRLGYEPSGTETVGAPDLAPAAVERLLRGFRVDHAYVLSNGVREYVATRRS